jgi:hypothetical protein
MRLTATARAYMSRRPEEESEGFKLNDVEC